MNLFRVAKGSEAAFEQVWLSRDSHLDKVPGFVEFHLLRGPEAEDHTLYAFKQGRRHCWAERLRSHDKLSSNFVGASIGRSAGFSPLRMRSR